jgi:hypothetical protein
MTKKVWGNPQVIELNVKATEYGNTITPHVDASFVDGGDTFFSFS